MSNKLFKIGIENYKATFFIGLYSEERKIPNTIIFNVKIGERVEDIENIPDWDYSVIGAIIEKVIASQEHHYKLEDVLKLLLTEFQSQYQYKTIYISIRKLNPPTNQDIGASFIEWEENNY